MTKGTCYREHLFYVLICCQSFLCHLNNSVFLAYLLCRNCVNIIWHNIIKNKPKSPRHICASDEKQITTRCLWKGRAFIMHTHTHPRTHTHSHNDVDDQGAYKTDSDNGNYAYAVQFVAFYHSHFLCLRNGTAVAPGRATGSGGVAGSCQMLYNWCLSDN